MGEQNRRIFAGVLAAGVLLLVWPVFSRAWTGALTGLSLAISSDAPAMVPAQSSVLLPVVVGFIVALPESMARRSRLLAAAVGLTLAGEIAIVLLGLWLGGFDVVMQSLRGLVQYAIPMSVAIVGIRETSIF